jgi:hypothetical protein
MQQPCKYHALGRLRKSAAARPEHSLLWVHVSSNGKRAMKYGRSYRAELISDLEIGRTGKFQSPGV